MEHPDEKAARLGSGGGCKESNRRGEHTTRTVQDASSAVRFGPNVGHLILLALALAGVGR